MYKLTKEDIPPANMHFYKKPTLDLARSLLGRLLVKQTTEGTASGIIVETEAYMGPHDRAAHSFGNRRTKRTEVMFGPSGYAYTYVMHTHCLVNVVSGDVGAPEAVLIRALEPYSGLEMMEERRPKAKKQIQWTNGPGKLTKALGIGMSDYGHRLDQEPLWISDNYHKNDFSVASGPRIGIDNSGEAREYPWRFWIKDNPYVSR
ncbi:DNA-3-methyladenine glycosylase [Sediminibacillus massiliensis]|uniref:DNA-3-methyladenine glycosylase n=1 Tax=Sediminibacillus massiliensis TaxID=1926277 RepID=UPI001FE8760F|nr:DNA-3-methyladenine glycosylase [Sediminibacillus massiliensis]